MFCATYYETEALHEGDEFSHYIHLVSVFLGSGTEVKKKRQRS